MKILLTLFLIYSLTLYAQEKNNAFIVNVYLNKIDNKTIEKNYSLKTYQNNADIDSGKVIYKMRTKLGDIILLPNSINESVLHLENTGVKISYNNFNQPHNQFQTQFIIYCKSKNKEDIIKKEHILDLDSSYIITCNLCEEFQILIKVNSIIYKKKELRKDMLRQEPISNSFLNFIISEHKIDTNKTKHIENSEFIAFCKSSKVQMNSTEITDAVLIIQNNNSYIIVKSTKIIYNDITQIECNDAKISKYVLKNSHSYKIGHWEGKTLYLYKNNGNYQISNQ